MSSETAIIGRTLAGRFRVTGFIGEGAMATVYRAVQEAEPHDVAVKIMHPHLMTDPTFVGRFRREAKAAAQIKHPNTVQILDCGVDGKLLYIAMELLAGQDLFETLVLERRLSEARAARILIQVADALVAAHAEGIVHRDLKPENIMLIRDASSPAGEQVKVLDFGIAKILERDQPPASDSQPISMSHSALTSVGMVVGTPAYMSPEQCRGEKIDARSDVYTCGILLYQIVVGRLPFSGDNAMDLAVKHVRTPPPPPRELIPAMHPGLEQVILTALAKWPAQRQEGAAELKAELERLLPELATKLHDLTAQPGAPPLHAEPLRRSSQQEISIDLAVTARIESPLVAKPSPAAFAITLDGEVRAAPPAAAPNPPPKAAAPAPAPAAAARAPEAAAPPLPATRSLAPPTQRPQQPSKYSWLIVPFALLVGIAVGTLAFFLTRP